MCPNKGQSTVKQDESKHQSHSIKFSFPIDRGVTPGGAGGAMAPPDFCRSVNPISTREGGRLCPSNNTGTPGFLDLTKVLIESAIIQDDNQSSTIHKGAVQIFRQVRLPYHCTGGLAGRHGCRRRFQFRKFQIRPWSCQSEYRMRPNLPLYKITPNIL